MRPATAIHPRKYKVLFVTPAFVYGGLERVILDLVRALNREKFEFMICSLFPPAEGMRPRLEQANVPFVALNKGEGINFRLVSDLARLIRRERVDLVNAHDIGATVYAAPASWRAGRVPVVHTDHSQILGIRRRRALFAAVLRWGTVRATTVSEHLRRFFIHELRYPADRITVIPNGMDLSAYDGPATITRAEFGFGPGDRIVGAIGRLTEQKGMIYLVRALGELAAEDPAIRGLIVGEGPDRPVLEQEAERWNVRDRIRFVGVRDDVPDLLRMMDVFVLPSLWEGQPLVLIEAMAAGTPIVASRVGGVPELLGDGARGLLVPPGDPKALAEAIRLALARPNEVIERIEAGRRHAREERSVASMAARYAALFEEVLAARRR